MAELGSFHLGDRISATRGFDGAPLELVVQIPPTEVNPRVVLSIGDNRKIPVIAEVEVVLGGGEIKRVPKLGTIRFGEGTK